MLTRNELIRFKLLYQRYNKNGKLDYDSDIGWLLEKMEELIFLYYKDDFWQALESVDFVDGDQVSRSVNQILIELTFFLLL